MNKKIMLYIDSMQFGGAQRVMNNIAEYYINRDVHVVLINDIIPSDIEPEYALDDRIERYFLDEGRTGKHNKNLYRIRKLRKLIKKIEPEVVLSFLGPPNIRMLVASLGLKVRKFVSVRNDPNQEYGKGIRKFIARCLFGLADGCVFQTNEAAMYFSKRVQKRSKIIVNPVNDKFYKVSWTGEKKEIAVVGRLQPQKNPMLALNAFSKLANDFSDYKLVYYGDEELKDEIVSKSKEYGIDKQVVIAGKVSDIENKLASSTLYLLSSDYEGMPNALLEAMAVGVPAISTDCPCGGPRTIITNNYTGVLVPVRNVNKMCDAIRMLLNDDELRKSMSRAEKTRAADFRKDLVMHQWAKFIGV